MYFKKRRLVGTKLHRDGLSGLGECIPELYASVHTHTHTCILNKISQVSVFTHKESTESIPILFTGQSVISLGFLWRNENIFLLNILCCVLRLSFALWNGKDNPKAKQYTYKLDSTDCRPIVTRLFVCASPWRSKIYFNSLDMLLMFMWLFVQKEGGQVNRG